MAGPAFAPIEASDDEIRAALAHASTPALMAAIMLMRGDYSALDGDIRPKQGVLGESQGFLSDEEIASVREQALVALREYRDAGAQAAPPPDDATLYRIMNFVAGMALPEDSVPLMLEELGLDGRDQRAATLSESARSKAGEHPVIIIGGGMSGILAAIRLQQASIPYVLLEKNSDKGGTWYENDYPGARVDIPAHIYCYTFKARHHWQQHFPKQHELKAYFDEVVEEYQLQENIRYGCEVRSARWQADTHQWRVDYDSDAGRQTLFARSVISAVGQLNRPHIPAIEGIEAFKGPLFHSAAFEHQHALQGKRIAVIGSGASAFQLVPELVKTAGSMKVFQRSPAWMFPNPGYHDDIAAGKQWLLDHVPYYLNWYRFLLFWVSADALLPTLIKDESWPHPERSVNATNDMYRQQGTKWIKSQVSDEALLAKVLPTYPPFVKRFLQDNGSWLGALQQDHVELVTDPIDSIDAEGIYYRNEKGDIEHVELDAIIFATGFHANKWLYPMDIVGRDGIVLNELWGDNPRAYLGMTVPEFPNFYCMYGPNTNLAHAGTLFFNSECQIRYIVGCINALLEADAHTIEVTKQCNDDYNQRLQEAFEKTVWTHEGTGSWYKNSQGNITTNTPWRLADYWRWTLAPDLDDFALDR